MSATSALAPVRRLTLWFTCETCGASLVPAEVSYLDGETWDGPKLRNRIVREMNAAHLRRSLLCEASEVLIVSRQADTGVTP